MRSFDRRRRAVGSRLVHAAWRRMQAAGTITAGTAAGRRFAAFGPNSLIAFPTGSVHGEQWIEIGDRTMFAEQVSVCAGIGPGHDLGPDSVLRIGNGCVIGRGSHIVAHYSIDIGDDVYTGPYVYITDQNHSYSDPEVPIGRQWPVNAGVRIGDGTWLGTGVVVLPGSVIGRNVVVAAGSVVRGEIGDQCVVAGVPARVVKDFSPETGWSRVPSVRRSDLNGRQYMTGLDSVPPGADGSAEVTPGAGSALADEIDGALADRFGSALADEIDGALADRFGSALADQIDGALEEGAGSVQAVQAEHALPEGVSSAPAAVAESALAADDQI